VQEGRTERGIWIALTGFVALILAIGVWSLWSGGEKLPVIAEVPPFELVDSSGKQVRRSDFDGDLWVADFIFTSCAGVCPILSSRMADVQRRLEERGLDVRLVSISVDPARDTPPALAAYAERYGADPERWTFLTGERDALYELIGKGFLLSVSERSPEEAGDSGDLITHSDRFVLVDRQGRIRGYYHGLEEEDVDRLLRDLESFGR